MYRSKFGVLFSNMVTNASLENLVGGKWTPKMYIDFKELIGDDEKENLEIEL